MKIYISLPISGHDPAQTRSRAEDLRQTLSSPWSRAITPFDVCPEIDKPYSYYMGRDIQALLECDAIFMADGWQSSRGCRLEHAAALIYGKAVYTESMLKNAKTIQI